MEHGIMEGVLLKRARSRAATFFSFTNWQYRKFFLLKQTLYYYHPEVSVNVVSAPNCGKNLECKVAPKGTVCVKDCVVRRVHPDDADGKSFVFVVNTSHSVDGGAESFLLSAESETIRHRWMQCIEAAAISESWAIKSKVIQRKTGQEITSALLAKKRDIAGTEDTAANVLSIISTVLKKEKGAAELKQLEKSLSIADMDEHSNDRERQTKKDAIQRAIDKSKRDTASVRINGFVNRSLVKKREYLRLYFRQCVVLIQTRTRVFLSRIRVQRLIVVQKAQRVVGKLLYRYLAAKRILQNHKWHAPNIFKVHVKSAKGLISSSAASSIYVNTMSCYDQSQPPRFKGKDENNVKNGYGLKVTSLHKGKPITYSHDPDWDEYDEKNSCALTVDTVDKCFIVLTFLTYDPVLRQDAFLGQAIISVAEHRARLYAGEEIHFKDYPLVRYVAPVEDTEGVAKVVLNIALQVRKVTGTVTFSVRLGCPTKSTCVSLSKESNAFFSAFHEDKFKNRTFVIENGHISYAHDKCSFGLEEKHKMDLSKVVSFTLEPYDKKRLHLKEMVFTAKENVAAKPEIWRIRWPENAAAWERNHLVRRVIRNMPQIRDSWNQPCMDEIFARFLLKFGDWDGESELAIALDNIKFEKKIQQNVHAFIERRSQEIANKPHTEH